MTQPTGGDVKPLPPWYVRPGIILPVLGLCVLLTAVLAPSPVDGRSGDPRLTTYSTEPLGARLLYQLSKKMGFDARQETKPIVLKDSSAVLVEFDPTTALTATEVHDMMDHVRGGGALLLALGTGTKELGDSLDVTVDSQGSYLEVGVGVTTGGLSASPGCPKATVQEIIARQSLWPGLPTLFALKDSAGPVSYAGERFISSRSVVFAGSRKSVRPTVVGFYLGAGRVVVSADPDVFRNDAVRECSYGFDVAVVRMLEYLRDAEHANRTTLLFDEYHLRETRQTGAIAAAREYLTTTPSGHALLQLCIAGLVLLFAAAPRVLAPREDVHVDRRSPLEHVDALARAYAQVGATQTGVQRLVRGLRRRVDRSTSRTTSIEGDDLFLVRVAELTPRLKTDVELVRGALNTSVSRDAFKDIGKAIERIETALSVQPA